MGFIRKVGKKVKKRFKKLFNSKLGRVIGMVGLYFALGAAAKGLSNWASSTFGQAGASATGGASAGAGAGTGASAGAGAGATGGASAGASTKTAADAIATASSNAEAANTAIAAVDSAAASGTLNTATTSITDAVAAVEPSLNQTIGELNKSIVDTANASIDFTAELQKPELFKSPTRMDVFKEGVGSIGEGIKNIPSKTGEFITDLPTKIAEAPGQAVDYLTSESFIPDVATGVTTSYVTSELMGEPEEQFFGGSVATQPQMEAAQGAYIAEVKNQIPNIAATNFQQMNQNLFYGTLSPQYLMGQMG